MMGKIRKSNENLMLKYGNKYKTDKITHHEYHKIYDIFLKKFYKFFFSI